MANPLDAPPALGRGVVVLPGQLQPPSLASAQRIRVDEHTIRADHPTITELHRAWATRTPIVIELGIDPVEFLVEERTDEPAWALGLGFLFPRERLRFLVWANTVDMRFTTAESPEGTWWHTRRALQYQGITAASADQLGDIVLPDGRVAWVDGGPRDACAINQVVVHREDIERGIISPVGRPVDPEVLASLTPDQQGAIQAGHGAVRVPAPAGSGKTRVLSARLATILGARKTPPDSVLSLVYNTRAAEELRARVGVTETTISTVHAHAYGLLRRHIPGIRVIDEREVRRALSTLVDVPRQANSDPIGPWIEAIDTVRATLSNPATAAQTYGGDLPDFAATVTEYRQRLRDSRVVDFAEMVPWATDLLLTNPQIRAHEQRHAGQVLVDEFQDLTPAYLFYIRLLASPQLAVFGVGDDDQVIYGHAGANPSFLIQFERYFPGAESHTLTTNHRCPVDVVAKTNTLLSHNKHRIAKTIQSAPGASTCPVTIHDVQAEDGADAARSIIQNRINSGVPLHDIAVLARVNVALLPVQAALTKAGVGFHSPITPSLLDRSAVRAALAYIRLAIDPLMSGSDIAEILHRPLRAIPGQVKEHLRGRRWTVDGLQSIPIEFTPFQLKAWRALCGELAALRRSARHQPTAEVLRRIIVDIDLGSVAKDLEAGDQTPGGATHTDDLTALMLVGEYCREVSEFEDFLRQVINPPAQDGQGVTLSSIHKVKGLEWPYVVLVGANEGTLPHRMAQQPEWIEEERRVFHVAITRAKIGLDIVTHRKSISRFIREMNGEQSRGGQSVSGQRSLRGVQQASSKRRNREPNVPAVLGLQVTLAGGLSGKIVEIRDGQVFIATSSRAILRVATGSVVRIDGKRVRLTIT
ncbi:ATP-dependent helicase [Stomatohabitans albus]|uniref:ATP-dependent helicase n=1 Tax=Stomatohabitans albus TaxID=3110766 RepID=UPI00300DB376